MISEPPISAEQMAERITRLREEVANAEERVALLQAELDWYLAGQRLFAQEDADPATKPPLPGLEPAPTTEPHERNGTRPTLREAIRLVLAQEPRETWTP